MGLWFLWCGFYWHGYVGYGRWYLPLLVVIVVLAGEGSWRNGVYTIAWMGWMVVVVEEKM